MCDFICPVCGHPLGKTEKTYCCDSGHSFDLAKSGYVNLFLSSAAGKRHGDDKRMVRARTAFLNKGFYDPLSKAIADCAAQYTPEHVCMVDAGCGEGKYTLDVQTHLMDQGKTVEVFGFDISKEALKYAAKRSPHFKLAVASSASIPLPDQSTDLLLNLFSPFVREEFLRILKPGGILLRAYPLENHLLELKQLIYDQPYENRLSDLTEPGFRISDQKEIRYSISLNCNEDIMNLFQMTPYYYKTGQKDQKKAEQAEHLKVSLSFGLAIYEKL